MTIYYVFIAGLACIGVVLIARIYAIVLHIALSLTKLVEKMTEEDE